LRLKEWQAFQFGNEQWFFVVALFDAKLMALAQLKAYDRERRRKYVFERQLPGWALRAPRNLLDSHMRWAGGGASISFVNRLAAGQIDVALDLPADAERPAIAGRLTARADGCEPEVVCIPFGDNRGMYSHKGCLALTGQLRLGDEEVTFTREDSFLLMDDHKGYYAHVMRWDWVTGGGFDARLQLANCRSPSGGVLTVRATSFDPADTGSYTLTVVFAAAGEGDASQGAVVRAPLKRVPAATTAAMTSW
jgi:hypothetical protein